MDSKAQPELNGSTDVPLEDPANSSFELMNSESRTPLKTPSKETEVKFIVSDSINGDAKIDVDHAKPGFGGMSKDELLKYINDPFWVRTRTILFILFWLIWVVMFIAAIAIIVMAPRCEAPKARKWHEEGPLMELALPKGGNSLNGVIEKLDYLANLNVKGIILPPIFAADGDGNVVDFKAVDKEYGTLEHFQNLVSAAKKKAIRILLTWIPNYTSTQHEWFKKSAANEEPYASYYIWAPDSGTSSDGLPIYPNNWLSIYGEPAWTLNNGTRKEYFLHQLREEQADLNFRNPKVVQEMHEVLTYWLNLGISGINLDKVQYLLEDPELKDEEPGDRPDGFLDQYIFWRHHQTYNYDGVAKLLAEWTALVHSSTDNDGIMIITGEAPTADNMNQTLGPDLVRDGTLIHLGVKLAVSDVAKSIRNILNKTWPAIEPLPLPNRLADIKDDIVDPFNAITLLLKGTPITQFGDEQGLLEKDANNFLIGVNGSSATPTMQGHRDFYEALSNVRESSSILHGETNIQVKNATLVLTRWKAGYPGYVLVYNTSPDNVTVDLTDFEQFPAELTVVAVGNNGGLANNARVATKSVDMLPQASVLFTFVPAG